MGSLLGIQIVGLPVTTLEWTMIRNNSYRYVHGNWVSIHRAFFEEGDRLWLGDVKVRFEEVPA